jgi:hypothetical protein
MPSRLSLVGAFKDLRTLTPADALVLYDVNLPFWSDGAIKSRWMALPAGDQIGFSPSGEWTFPAGTIFVKHFDMVIDERQPARKRRLETRVLVLDNAGGVYGRVYKWRADGSDADLLAGSVTEPITIQTAAGPRTQTWYYPAPADCRTCHTPRAGKALGVSTRQLNRDLVNPTTGAAENQLRAWNRAGRFKPGLFDARYDTPLAQQNLINGPALINLGIEGARAIAPGDPKRSIILKRVDTRKAVKMPPLARETIDAEGVALLREWIESLPAPQSRPRR